MTYETHREDNANAIDIISFHEGVSSGSGDDLHHANEAITENTGAARLAESWKWHCGAITAGMNQQGESTWQEC